MRFFERGAEEKEAEEGFFEIHLFFSTVAETLADGSIT